MESSSHSGEDCENGRKEDRKRLELIQRRRGRVFSFPFVNIPICVLFHVHGRLVEAIQ